MGIKEGNKLIKAKAPGSMVEMYLSSFRGQRIAIDMHIVAHALKSVAHNLVVSSTDVVNSAPDEGEINRIYKNMLLEYLLKYFKRGIIPVCVFDGDIHPDKLINTTVGRSEEKQQKRDNLERILIVVRGFANPLQVPADYKDALKKAYEDSFSVNSNDYYMIKDLLGGLGIPVLRAKHDAEQLCATLCIHGYCAATVSTDTDLYPLACPFVITKVGPNVTNRETGSEDNKISITNTKEILIGANMDLGKFIDLCIMLKCDNNQRVYNVGLAKCLELIESYGNIDNIIKNQENIKHLKNKDLSVWNHLNCRSYFYIKTIQEVIYHEDLDLDLDEYLRIKTEDMIELGPETLSIYGCDVYLKEIINYALHIKAPARYAINIISRSKPNFVIL